MREEDNEALLLHVLIVDDDDGHRAPQVAYLESLGCRVEQATDGAAGVKSALASRPDVVVMDVGMPVMDGLEAARYLRRLPSAKRPYIIALSAFGDARTRQLVFEAGCDEFILKPGLQLGGALRAFRARRRGSGQA